MRRSGVILVAMSLAMAAIPMAATAQVVDSVLVYTGGGLGAPYQGHVNFGVATGKSVVVSETLPENLAEYDCVILPINNDLSEVTSSLVSYVNGGGRLIAEGEGATFAASNAAMNALADALGANLDLVPADLDSGFHVTNVIDPSPYTGGVASITYAYTSGIAVAVGPTAFSLVRTADDPENPEDVPTTFIGADQIGAGLFVLSGDSNVFSDNSDDGYTAQDNGVLAANLCPSGAEPTADLSVAKVARQDTVTAGGNAAFTITVTNNSETEATNVTVTDSASFGEGGATIVSAEGEGWDCVFDEGGSVTCSLGSLAGLTTSSEILVIVQAPSSTGTIVNTATVSDETPDNNSSTATTNVEAAGAGSVETFVDGDGATLATTGGQGGWDTTMVVPVGAPSGIYRLTEVPDPVQGSKGAVEYEAPAGAEVTVQVSCNATQCPKKKGILDLLVLVIKIDDDGSQHLLPPCHLVVRRIVIDNPAPCVVSVTRAPGRNGALTWSVKLPGGPDPTVRGR